MSFPIGNQIKQRIQLALFDRINSMNRTDANRNPLSNISDEIELNPYSNMLTKSCWVRISSTSPKYKVDETTGKTIRPLKVESEEPLQIRGDYENGKLKNQPITTKSNLGNFSPNSNLRAPVGVTGVSTSFKNHSIQNITINWKIYDPDDFEIYEKAFLKHGRNVLVEFGWSVPGIEFNTCKSVNDMFDFYNELERKIIEGGGNYYAAIGLVKSFTWNIGPNGEYDCQTELTSMGNTLFKTTTDPAGNTLELTKAKNQDAVDKAFQEAGLLMDELLEQFNQILHNQSKRPDLHQVTSNGETKDRVFFNEKEGKGYCSWSFFEEKVLNRFFAISSSPDKPKGFEGLLTYIDSSDESFEPIPGTGPETKYQQIIGDNACRWNRNLVTISRDIIIPESILGLDAIKTAGSSEANVSPFDDETTRTAYAHLYETFDTIQRNFKSFRVQGKDYGIIKNFVFSADFLAEQFRGVRDLESGLNSFWSNVSSRYGYFWDFAAIQSQSKSGKISMVDRYLTKYRVKDINPFRVEGKESTYENLSTSTTDPETVFIFPLYSNRGIFKSVNISVNMSSAMATQAMFSSNSNFKLSGTGGNPSPENKGVVALGQLYNQTISGEQEETTTGDPLLKDIYFPFIKGLGVKRVETKDENGEVTGVGFELNEDLEKGNVLSALEKDRKQAEELGLIESKQKGEGQQWFSIDEKFDLRQASLVYDRDSELMPSYVSGMFWWLNKSPEARAEIDPVAPLKLSFTMPGIAGIKMYDLFTTNYLPREYRLYSMFMVTGISHTLSTSGWETSIEANIRIDTKSLQEDALNKYGEAPKEGFDGTLNASTEDNLDFLYVQNRRIAESKVEDAEPNEPK